MKIRAAVAAASFAVIAGQAMADLLSWERGRQQGLERAAECVKDAPPFGSEPSGDTLVLGTDKDDAWTWKDLTRYPDELLSRMLLCIRDLRYGR